jgi:tRNA (guanine-N7-)-methyltransferase
MVAPHRRRYVSTFHARHGRMTAQVRDHLERLPRLHGVPDGIVDPQALFGRSVPFVVEIGSGHGQSALGYAEAHPGHDLVAIEVHKPGIAQLLGAVEARGLTNLRVLADDAVAVLDHRLAAASVDEFHLFFPDPWPKRAHNNRRFVRPDLMDLVAQSLAPGGILLVATDHPDYSAQIRGVLDAHPWFELVATDRPAWRPVTSYEAKALTLGRTPAEYTYRRLVQPSR